MGWFSWWTEGKRHTVQRSLEGVGLADFSDIGPTLELHDELKSLEGEAQHLTATVKEALAHARRHAIAMSRSLCPPQTAATAGRTPPEDSPVGLALKAAVDDFSTRVHREVIRFSQGAETPASVTSGHSRATTVTVVPGAVFSGLQAATQCAKVTESRIEELKLIRLDFDSYRRKAAKAQAKVDAARAQGEGAGMTERQARYLEKLQDHLLRRKQKLAECGEAFDRLEDDLVREMETSKAAGACARRRASAAACTRISAREPSCPRLADHYLTCATSGVCAPPVVPMLQQAPHNFLELQAAFHARLADAAAQFTQSGSWAGKDARAEQLSPRARLRACSALSCAVARSPRTRSELTRFSPRVCTTSQTPRRLRTLRIPISRRAGPPTPTWMPQSSRRARTRTTSQLSRRPRQT